MDYRDVLKEQLRRRKELNPKYSMRAFAKKIELSPSKVSEVISGKKRLGVDRAEVIAGHLGLSGSERELFVLSAELESTSARQTDRKELASRMRTLTNLITAAKTEQLNAWYFGAVKALEENQIEAGNFADNLGITDIQIENAKRFLKRMERAHPDRREISFEPLSLFKKIEDDGFLTSSPGIEADCLMLSAAELDELRKKMKSAVRAVKAKRSSKHPKDLRLVYWGAVDLLKN